MKYRKRHCFFLLTSLLYYCAMLSSVSKFRYSFCYFQMKTAFCYLVPTAVITVLLFTHCFLLHSPIFYHFYVFDRKYINPIPIPIPLLYSLRKIWHFLQQNFCAEEYTVQKNCTYILVHKTSMNFASGLGVLQR